MNQQLTNGESRTMTFYDCNGAQIEIGSKCEYELPNGSLCKGTIAAIGVTSYSASQGTEPSIQWEALVENAAEDAAKRCWVTISRVKILKAL